MDEKTEDVVIPIIGEEVHMDAVPVVTGGVRVTKRVESHDEIIEQELRKSHVEVKRVQTNRVVDGPQPVHRIGGTLIIPVVSEVLRVEKQWVVTEEIHITEQQSREIIQNKVTVNREEADVERIDSGGTTASEVHGTFSEPVGPPSILQKASPPGLDPKRRVLARPRSIVKDRSKDAT